MATRKVKRIEKIGHTHFVRVPVVWFVADLVIIAGLTLALWSAERGRNVHLSVKEPGDFAALLPSIVGLTQSSLERGNRVQLLENGDGFFPLLLRDVAAARESIHLESYIWWKGPICDQVAAALAAKARQGVEVRLLVDASGGRKMDRKLRDEMLAAGCQVRAFHPLRFSNAGRLNNRDHRKEIIIDGRVGYVGGYGIAKEWTGNGQDREHWRDTGVRVEGPVVNRLQSAFMENWTEETGEIPAGLKYFPPPSAAGPTAAHLAYTSPTGGVSSVQVLYYLAIASARKSIVIQNPYMLPDEDARKALADAVKRGVDVRVMVPATTATDSPIVQHASHHELGALLQSGVKVWEFERTLLHQKILVVDGVWSCVGSTNFDDRSFQLNDEISMGILDPTVAAQLTAAFEADRKFAQQRTFEEWKRRGVWHKIVDGLAYLGSSQL
ncbi:MAG TPA: cardiolipin synthase [Thermoanaerobaculia bacterium]|nr:cardiolipin synthase [Thermoanaerobaculia bacterium]